jgi:hypothetical protein
MSRPSRDRFVHTVNIFLQSTEAKDATGSLTIPLGVAIATNIPCLVSDKGGSRYPAFLMEVERKKVRVSFCDYRVLRLGNILIYTTPAGIVRTLQVDSFRDDQDLGRLWIAECSEVPNPGEGQT